MSNDAFWSWRGKIAPKVKLCEQLIRPRNLSVTTNYWGSILRKAQGPVDPYVSC